MEILHGQLMGDDGELVLDGAHDGLGWGVMVDIQQPQSIDQDGSLVVMSNSFPESTSITHHQPESNLSNHGSAAFSSPNAPSHSAPAQHAMGAGGAERRWSTAALPQSVRFWARRWLGEFEVAKRQRFGSATGARVAGAATAHLAAAAALMLCLWLWLW